VVDEIVKEVEGLVEEAQTVVLSEEGVVDELTVLFKGLSVEYTDFNCFFWCDLHVHS
jgi:hypothetical protein